MEFKPGQQVRNWLESAYARGFRLRCYGQQLNRAIINRAQELGFYPSKAVQQEAWGEAEFFFWQEEITGPELWCDYEQDSINLPEVSLDEFFEASFPRRHDLIAQRGVIVGTVGDYVAYQEENRYCWIAGQHVYVGIIQDLHEHMIALQRTYGCHVTVTVGNQVVTPNQLAEVLRRWSRVQNKGGRDGDE